MIRIHIPEGFINKRNPNSLSVKKKGLIPVRRMYWMGYLLPFRKHIFASDQEEVPT